MSEEYDDDRYITLENLNWGYDWVGIDAEFWKNEEGIIERMAQDRIELLEHDIRRTFTFLVDAAMAISKLKRERNNT